MKTRKDIRETLSFPLRVALTSRVLGSNGIKSDFLKKLWVLIRMRRGNNVAIRYTYLEQIWVIWSKSMLYLGMFGKYPNGNIIIILKKIGTNPNQIPSNFLHGNVSNDELEDDRWSIIPLSLPLGVARRLDFSLDLAIFRREDVCHVIRRRITRPTCFQV